MTDYIIVGGGSAGCVLANRLSADPAITVTLLEAGPESNSVFYRMPAGFFRLMQTGKGNWNYETTPQPGLNGRTMYVPRGKVLGGSSSINGLVHIRGNAGDFDRWAQMGNTGWSYADCLPYFRRSENYAGGASEYHGAEGPMKVSEGPALEAMSPAAKAMVEAAIEAGHRYNPDQNGAFQDGFGPASGNFGDGIRQSTYACYVRPALDRPNLTVLTGAQASRIVITGNRATGVEYVKGGRKHTLTADREVILAGGAIHSPQILQLSGIGDPVLLAQHGIRIVAPLPAVGATDQHSQVQLFMEGPLDKTVTFITVKGREQEGPIPARHADIPELSYLAGHTLGELIDIEQRATAGALAARGRFNATLAIDTVDAFHMGALMQTFALATAYAGVLYDVNAFNQPGVELGKNFAYAMLGRAGSEQARAEWDALPKPDPRFTV